MSLRQIRSRQDRAWTSIIAVGGQMDCFDGVRIETYAGTGARRDLRKADLCTENGMFRRALMREGQKMGAVAYVDGLPVAHALLMDDANYGDHSIMSWGFTLGLLGCFTADDFRGRGLATQCLKALDGHILNGLTSLRRQAPSEPVAICCDTRLLKLARRCLSLHVDARPGVEDTHTPALALQMRKDAWRAFGGLLEVAA